VENHLEAEEPELLSVFQGSYPIGTLPQTLAIETTRKIILAYGPGRDVNYIIQEGMENEFDRYLKIVNEKIVNFPDGVTVIALSIPWPLDRGSKMIHELREKFGDKIKIFIGSSSFRNRRSRLNVKTTKEIYDKILKKADINIISCNDKELHDLHTVIVGKGAYKDISLAYKLKQIPIEAIKICHSADGAILDLGCNPEKIINSEQFHKDPYGYLEEALRLSVDGATYALDSVEVGKKANESMIRTYSASVTDRCTELFRTTFLKTVERLPAGIIAIQAPLVVNPLATLTDIGAIFDSLLLSFLMRD
jgi:hypothetical protein